MEHGAGAGRITNVVKQKFHVFSVQKYFQHITRAYNAHNRCLSGNDLIKPECGLTELVMSSVSQQNPVRVFIAHAFESNDDYRRVFEYLESSRNFFYKNTSVPELPAGLDLDKEGLRQELRKQINLAEVVLIPAATFIANQEWVDFELNCAD